jgi:flavin reductase (DIM6/NTAB) family NADH-FMN oxidoreductase RutF
MHFNLSELPQKDRYKLLISTIVPRPIAWISSLNANGSVNLAPFSAFGYMGSDPALIAVSPAEGKQTLDNIRREREFVVNMVPVALLDAMNLSATDFPIGESELEYAGLEAGPSVRIRTPRVAQSPVNFECQLHSVVEVGRNRVVIAEVLELHLPDELVNSEKMYVDTRGLDIVGRMGGGDGYATTRDEVQLERIAYQGWLKSR